ncbi:MAG: hypothetical protein FWG99_07835 [Treponema sp.]|nr:hypothetical protein [Treponema sp.]
MKKLVKLIGLIALITAAGFTMIACPSGGGSSDGSGYVPSGGSNYGNFTLRGKTYTFGQEGEIQDYGSEFSLCLFTEQTEDLYIIIEFDLYGPENSDVLVAGTYNMSETNKPFTFDFGCVDMNTKDDSNYYYVSGGTVKVTVSGKGENATYTITIDCTLEDDDEKPAGTVKGTYKGPITYI